MTFEDFSQVFAILAVQLRATDADQATVQAYYNALAKLPLELVVAAADQLAQTSEWFPKTSEWVTTAKAIDRTRTLDVEGQRRANWRPLCERCDDTGWQRIESTRAGGNGWEVTRCACKVLRRDEVLGRAPLPPVERAPETVDEAARARQLHALVMPLVKKSADAVRS